MFRVSRQAGRFRIQRALDRVSRRHAVIDGETPVSGSWWESRSQVECQVGAGIVDTFTWRDPVPHCRLLAALLLLLGACTDGASVLAPPDDPAAASSVAPTGAPEAAITCIATSTTSGYSVTVSWDRLRVRIVSVVTEVGTFATELARPMRRGSVTFTLSFSEEPLGFRLEDGKTIVAQGGCAAP